VLITSTFTKLNNDKNYSLKYITEERQKWRIEIRDKISEFCNPTERTNLRILKTEIRLRINPKDDEDQKIVKCMESIIKGDESTREKYREQLEELVSHLLKHDWERAKREASSWKLFKKKIEREVIVIIEE